MPLLKPNYMIVSGVPGAPITHAWNDSNPEAVYLRPDERLRSRLTQGTESAIVALCLGFAEWVAWRLDAPVNDPMLLHYIEACWAGLIDWTYVSNRNIPNPSWKGAKGPLRGPLCGAWKLLNEIVYLASTKQATSPETVSLSRIAEHVSPDSKVFKQWRQAVIQRMVQLHPRSNEDVYGPPVPREALDPDFLYNIDQAPQLLALFVEGLDCDTNPYLSTPEEMRGRGFQGQPYSSSMA